MREKFRAACGQPYPAKKRPIRICQRNHAYGRAKEDLADEGSRFVIPLPPLLG
jgi:hypothetical protein